jgi:hypothetical protein
MGCGLPPERPREADRGPLLCTAVAQGAGVDAVAVGGGELEAGSEFTIKTMPKRVAKMEEDPLLEVLECRPDLAIERWRGGCSDCPPTIYYSVKSRLALAVPLLSLGIPEVGCSRAPHQCAQTEDA